MPNWCSNCIGVAGPHADVAAATAQLMSCEVGDDDQLMSDIARGEISMQPLTKQEGRSCTVTAFAVSKSWSRMFKSEDALLARCLEYVPGECRFVVRFMTPWGPPWTDEERPAQHLGTAPFMAIQCTNEHALQRISNQFHIAIRFRWADFDRALDDSHAGQSVFEHGCQDLSKSWQRRQDRKVDGPSYHWATCRIEECDGHCTDGDSSGAARGQLRSRYWGPFKDLLQTVDLQANIPAALRALWH